MDVDDNLRFLKRDMVLQSNLVLYGRLVSQAIQMRLIVSYVRWAELGS